MWLRRVILGLPLILILFFIATFITVRLSTPKKLNQYSIGTIGEPETLNPILSTTTAASAVENRVFNGLVRLDENLELEGDLARSWDFRQTSKLFFASQSEAKKALTRITSHRSDWEAVSLRKAEAPSNVLRLNFTSPGISYREKLFQWLGDLKALPVSFLTIQLETKKKFDDGATVNSDECIRRIKQVLATSPDVARRVIYYWTGGASAYVEMPVFGPTESFVKPITALLRADDEAKALGKCKAEEPMPTLDEPEITFHLRNGVRWHDGQPFTSADVLFTYKSIMSEEVASPRRSDFELIYDVRAPTPHTVRAAYKKPYAPALLSWGMNMIPKHILDGKDTKWWAKNFNRTPVGTGPFIFETWRTNEVIEVRKNPDYWEGPPHLDCIAIRFIPDVLSLRMSFETGELDVLGVDPHALGAMRKNPNYEIFSTLANHYSYVGWNLKRPLFQDRRVRQALAHAVNVPQIIQYVLYGQGVQSNGTYTPLMWYHNPDVQPFMYDPDRARELLAEAGWAPKDAGGCLVKDGKPFEFTLITNQGNEIRKDITALVQEDLRKIGINVEVEIYEWSVFIKKKIDVQDFDACVLGWVLGHDYDLYQLWHSSQSFAGGLNFCSYSNPRVDKLIELARGEFDTERVKKYCRETQRIIYEDQPYLFLYVPNSITALHKNTFRVWRPLGDRKWSDEPIRETKAGVGVYNTWWYRMASPPKGPPRAAR